MSLLTPDSQAQSQYCLCFYSVLISDKGLNEEEAFECYVASVLTSCFAHGVSPAIPTNTILLLNENHSDMISFAELTTVTRTSLKKAFFPGDFEDARSLKK